MLRLFVGHARRYNLSIRGAMQFNSVERGSDSKANFAPTALTHSILCGESLQMIPLCDKRIAQGKWFIPTYLTLNN